MTKKFHFITTIFSVVVLTIASALWLQIAIGAVWQGPGDNPPNDNVDAPLNVGNQYQSKAGDLDINDLYLQNKSTRIHFAPTGPALVFDATNNNDWDMLLYEGGLHMGAGESFYLNNSAIYDDADGIVNIGESLAVTGNSLTVNGNEVCRQDGTNCPSYTETDPQVGNLNNGDWCVASGGQVVCNQPAPSEGGSGDITGVYSGEGTKGGSSSGDATIEFDCSEVASTGLSCSGENIRVKNTSFSCNSGYSLRSIDINTGAKTCEHDDIGGSSGCSNTYRYVQSDSGRASAAGCSDTLGIRGGTGISTSRSGDNIYINASGASTPSLSCVYKSILVPQFSERTLNCNSGYQRTGCTFWNKNGGGKPNDSNGCRFFNSGTLQHWAYTICCKIE